MFAAWSDGGPASHTIVTPAAAATFGATFAHAARATNTGDTYARSGNFAAQNFGTATTLGAKQSTNVEVHRQAFLKFDVPVGPVSWPRQAPGIAELVGGDPGRRRAGGVNLLVGNRVDLEQQADTRQHTPGDTDDWRRRGAGPVDVTSYVRAERAAGRSVVSLALTGTMESSPDAIFNSA